MAPKTKTAGTETEAKTAVEKTAALKTATEKKTTAKKAPAKSATAKKAPAKSAAAKKTTTTKKAASKKAPKIDAEIQFDGKSVTQEVLLQRIYDAWAVTGHDKDAVKSISVYLKPAENRAYYVINESENGSIFMF